MFVNIYTHVFVAVDPKLHCSFDLKQKADFRCSLQVRSGVSLTSKLLSIFQWNCSICMYFLAIC